MKRIFLSVLIIGAFLSSCSTNGKKAETKDAEKVKIVENDQTVSYQTIKSGSFITWRATHLGGVQPRYGKVYFKDAKVLVNKGQISNASIKIDMSTLTVESFPEGAEEIAKLTGHLKSPDFFNIEKYPYSKFELTRVQKTEGEYNSVVTGNLTILDVTKSITFNANISIADNEVSIKSENFSVDRKNWGLTYNTEGTEGVPVDYLISDDISFNINLILSK